MFQVVRKEQKNTFDIYVNKKRDQKKIEILEKKQSLRGDDNLYIIYDTVHEERAQSPNRLKFLGTDIASRRACTNLFNVTAFH